MWIFVGLGNPGDVYAGTRHNVGFSVVDAVAARTAVPLAAGPGDYLIGTGAIGGQAIALVKPLTYMNNSGTAVRDIVERYGADLGRVVVIVDDFHLPLGILRLRLKGSDGGHNGLYSIIYHLQCEQFPRLRCGIAGNSLPGNKNEMARYVLSRFEDAEEPAVGRMVKEARDAIVAIAADGFEPAMNRVNRQKD